MIDDALLQKVKTRIDEILPEIVAIRHEIHQNPEIGLKEYETRQRIANALAGTSLDIWPALMETDLIGEFRRDSARTICLRADIDALPIFEQTGLSYASQTNGMMHACGHDGHTAIMIGTAMTLDHVKEALPDTVRFVFQPGEEMVCGGRTLVDRGACKDVDASFALHGWPGAPVGQILCREGALFAAGACFKITIKGKGCHGAMPERGNNPIPIGAKVVEHLKALHDKVNSGDRTVVTVCSFRSGSTSNIVPDAAIIEGTTRYLDPALAHKMEAAIRQAIDDACAGSGATVDIDYDGNYDTPVLNTRSGFDCVRDVATSALPGDCWQEAAESCMAMEDFAFYLKGREGAMFWLGVGEDTPPLHNPAFNFHDDAIATGILMFSLIALNGGIARGN